MKPFVIFELLIILAVVYLLANIIRYLFFRSSSGGTFFGLSEKWIQVSNITVKKGKRNVKN
jgi:hypothetical protein